MNNTEKEEAEELATKITAMAAVATATTKTKKKSIGAISKIKTNNSECFTKLSRSSQKLASNISSMGFPLERVCRVTATFGNDDKKV